jgi:hypothetical protein
VKRLLALAWSSSVVGLIGSACVYDPDDRCGPHQVVISHNRCACEPGFVPGDSGCEPCGDNERESSGACVCVDGYARPAEGAACEVIPAELGATCDTQSEPCSDGPYPLCHETNGSSGYCTSSCSSDEDCSGGYKCHTDGAEGFCRRPPVGYGKSCDSDEDCEGGEATFCETIQQYVCLVPCSAGNIDGCFEGEVCCNFVVFEPICVPADACTANGGLEVE